MKLKLIGLSFAFLLFGCEMEGVKQTEKLKSGVYFHSTMQKLTDIMVHDIFSPPVASRIYAYPSIAAYECMVSASTNTKSMAGQLNGLTPVPQPDPSIEYNYQIASLKAFIMVGKTLIFSEEKFNAYEKDLFQQIKEEGISEEILKNSISYGEKVGSHILQWADKDNYKQTRTFPKYTIRDNKEYWRPTPPAYMDGIEPSWNKIRPFIIDSATQFIPVRPTKFELEENTPFYKEIMEVYNVVNNLNEEQTEIASFWDCNPYVSHHVGHVMFATKKITPGGHWIGITSIACKQKQLDFQQSTEAYMRVSIAIADAFVSCWDEKYRSILIRPETLINQYIDEDWEPLLQTPPFPEYTSGHSVVSTTASVILTDLFGDDFHFVDSTEVQFGLGVRVFDSFNEASGEAAISRLYGGIHYMPAIKNGVDQGRKIGVYVVENLPYNKWADNLME